MTVQITTLAQRPELADSIWFDDAWPEFMQQDLVGHALFGRIHQVFADFAFVATDQAGQVVARAHSVPFALRHPERGTLPAAGWDQVLVWAFSDRRRAVTPDTVSAVEVVITADRQGQGLSALMLDAMRRNARAHGFAELVAPVRPSAKHHEPATPMAEYARRTRPDGLPADPWLRTHVRAGGVIDAVAPASMTVGGSLAQWREWTALPFDQAGLVEVSDALVPVHCVPEHDYAVYVEPNVWVRHALQPGDDA
jgi:GNAT superfamily N-acetyltransferase